MISSVWIRVNYTTANEFLQQCYRISNGVQLKEKRLKANVKNHLNFDSCEIISSSFLGYFFFCVWFFFAVVVGLAFLVRDKTLLFTGVIRHLYIFWAISFIFLQNKEWKKWLKKIVQGHSTISKIGLL